LFDRLWADWFGCFGQIGRVTFVKYIMR
jgi:hypothetical protein